MVEEGQSNSQIVPGEDRDTRVKQKVYFWKIQTKLRCPNVRSLVKNNKLEQIWLNMNKFVILYKMSKIADWFLCLKYSKDTQVVKCDGVSMQWI